MLKRYFVFGLDNKKIAVPLLTVHEVISPREYTTIPERNSFIRGVINLRGEIITLIDIKEKMGHGISEITEKKTCFVIFEIDSIKTSIIVDDIYDVLEIDENSIQPLTDLKSSKFIDGLYKANEAGIILIADPLTLLDIKEIQSLINVA